MLYSRILAYACFTIAVGFLFYEIYCALHNNEYRFISAGELWSQISANTLVGFGALMEKNISPWIWGEVIVPILAKPIWLIIAVLGIWNLITGLILDRFLPKHWHPFSKT